VTDHQPLLQLSTPIRQNEEPQVVLRLDSDKDVEAAIALINRTSEVLVPLAAGLVDHLARALQGEAVVTSQLQAAGLNPVPMPTVPATYAAPPAQPVYQPQQQSTQAYAPPAQQAAPQQMILMQGQCWADPRHVADCKDCGQATYLKTVKMRGDRELNAHQCAVDPNHKLTWCMTPIWESRRRDAQGKGIQVPDGLIFG
jgi:hypothetical protein